MTTESALLPVDRVQAASAVEAAGAKAKAAAPVRLAGRSGVSKWLISVASAAGFLGLWEVLARTGVAPPEIPPFSDVARWLFRQLDESTFWTALRQTLWHWFGGLLIGGAAGIVVGAAIGMVPLVRRLLNVPLEFLRSIPSIVYLPLLILQIGTRSKTATLLAAAGAFWPMLYQTIYGARAVDPQVADTGKVFGLKRHQILRHVVYPSILPYVATGVRIASSLALVVGISAELIAGVPGLGSSLRTAQLSGNYPATYGFLLVTGVLGVVLNAVLERTERWVLRWHVSHRVVTA